ncbi:enoyl-CoA hydratase-related protein [Dactylosporangium sp. NPDC051484]|uniref:enoyl-CoA hydratase/isomerase family protein n=1 Tax=Dactylosporangium sp. NPDC051484 TaxID=3154942 RepID=UPI00345043DE
MTAQGSRVTVEYDDAEGLPRVAVVTFDRPPVNAIDGCTKDELIAVARDLSIQHDLGAVVIGGTRYFAAGDDIKEMASFERGYAVQGLERISEAVAAVAAIPVPVVAAVTGFALGGGCELALAADFRVAGVGSTWGLPEVHLGLIPGGGGTQRLPRLVGTARAKRMIYLGETIDGTEAVSWGLADEVVPDDQVFATARRLARELTRRAPIAIRAAKRAIDSGADCDLATGLQLESALFASVFSTQDAATGLASFLTDGPRKATFQGR